MNRDAIESMFGLEDTHWWYVGLRDLLARTLRTREFRLPEAPRILDAGCGTGANLQFLQNALSPAYLGGFDVSPDAVRLTRSRGLAADVYCGDLCDPEVRASELDLVLCCDVLSIAGIAPAQSGLRRLVAALKHGGLFVVNMPAFAWLHSAHDAAIGTRDRVTAAQLAALLDSLGLAVQLLSYRVFALFPLIVAARLPSMWRGPSCSPESDLRRTFALSNGLFSRVLFAENEALLRGARWPWGTSVYAVARKR